MSRLSIAIALACLPVTVLMLAVPAQAQCTKKQGASFGGSNNFAANSGGMSRGFGMNSGTAIPTPFGGFHQGFSNGMNPSLTYAQMMRNMARFNGAPLNSGFQPPFAQGTGSYTPFGLGYGQMPYGFGTGFQPSPSGLTSNVPTPSGLTAGMPLPFNLQSSQGNLSSNQTSGNSDTNQTTSSRAYTQAPSGR
jgi:hypothetical protein